MFSEVAILSEIERKYNDGHKDNDKRYNQKLFWCSLFIKQWSLEKLKGKINIKF